MGLRIPPDRRAHVSTSPRCMRSPATARQRSPPVAAANERYAHKGNALGIARAVRIEQAAIRPRQQIPSANGRTGARSLVEDSDATSDQSAVVPTPLPSCRGLGSTHSLTRSSVRTIMTLANHGASSSVATAFDSRAVAHGGRYALIPVQTRRRP